MLNELMERAPISNKDSTRVKKYMSCFLSGVYVYEPDVTTTDYNNIVFTTPYKYRYKDVSKYAKKVARALLYKGD